jgi:3-hydroxyisobutyrate dehydrogenase
VLITMLPTSRDVAAALADAAPALAPEVMVVEMSSGIPAVTQTLAADLLERGVVLIDGPVSGGVARAETGELSIMVGGEAAAVARATPILQAMGTSIHHCGAVGAGQAMKALNNLMSAAGFLVGIEALLIGKTFGLDPQRMVDVLNASTGMNNSTQKKFTQFVLSHTFDSGFGLDLMAKDLGIASDMAMQAGVVAPFSGLCAQMWAGAANVLGPGRDHTEMARFSEAVSGHEVV